MRKWLRRLIHWILRILQCVILWLIEWIVDISRRQIIWAIEIWKRVIAVWSPVIPERWWWVFIPLMLLLVAMFHIN